MYRCQVCGACSKPGQPRRVHVIERVVALAVRPFTINDLVPRKTTRTEIEREVPVCVDCDKMLVDGLYTYAELRAMYRSRPAPDPLPPPAPPVAVNQPVQVGRKVNEATVQKYQSLFNETAKTVVPQKRRR